MTQRDRDWLMVLKKAQKKLIRQRQAAEELGVTERQVRRMLSRPKASGDKSAIHGLRGRPSNRKLGAEVREQAMRISVPGTCMQASGRRWPASTWQKSTS